MNLVKIISDEFKGPKAYKAVYADGSISMSKFEAEHLGIKIVAQFNQNT
ncbi:hypothetical protein [Methylomonas sp. AM2-LC]